VDLRVTNWQTNYDEFLDDFAMKKAITKLSQLFTLLCSVLLVYQVRCL